MTTTNQHTTRTVDIWEIDNDGRGPNTWSINELLTNGDVIWHNDGHEFESLETAIAYAKTINATVILHPYSNDDA